MYPRHVADNYREGTAGTWNSLDMALSSGGNLDVDFVAAAPMFLGASHV